LRIWVIFENWQTPINFTEQLGFPIEHKNLCKWRSASEIREHGNCFGLLSKVSLSSINKTEDKGGKLKQKRKQAVRWLVVVCCQFSNNNLTSEDPLFREVRVQEENGTMSAYCPKLTPLGGGIERGNLERSRARPIPKYGYGYNDQFSSKPGTQHPTRPMYRNNVDRSGLIISFLLQSTPTCLRSFILTLSTGPVVSMITTTSCGTRMSTVGKLIKRSKRYAESQSQNPRDVHRWFWENFHENEL